MEYKADSLKIYKSTHVCGANRTGGLEAKITAISQESNGTLWPAQSARLNLPLYIPANSAPFGILKGHQHRVGAVEAPARGDGTAFQISAPYTPSLIG